jgi:ketosteroid isomerase-like protein
MNENNTMKSAVDAVRARHIMAVNSADIDAAAGIFASDGTFLPPHAPALSGPPAIKAWFSKAFEMVRFEAFSLEPGSTVQDGDLCVEHGAWTATVVPRDGSPSGPAGGTYLTVYKRHEDGEVSVIRDCFNGLPG